MNIQKPRKLISRIFIILFSVVFTSCEGESTKKNVSEIINAKEIIGENYQFSEESTLNLDGKSYHLISKAIYDLDGNIVKAILYKPEGLIEYSLENLKDDKKLFEYLEFPLNQKWKISGGFLFKTNENKVEVLKLTPDTFVFVNKAKTIVLKTNDHDGKVPN